MSLAKVIRGACKLWFRHFILPTETILITITLGRQTN